MPRADDDRGDALDGPAPQATSTVTFVGFVSASNTAERFWDWATSASISCLEASVAQNRGIQLRSVESTVEGAHDVRGILGADTDVRNGFNDVKVTFTIDADTSRQEIEALVAQSQKRSAVFDALTNPTNVTVEVA